MDGVARAIVDDLAGVFMRTITLTMPKIYVNNLFMQQRRLRGNDGAGPTIPLS